MDNEHPPTNAAQRGRRSTHRHRRGAYINVSLGNSARLAFTHHLARKNQTSRPPDSEPISTMFGNYHHAPLNSHRVNSDVHPHIATRGDLHSDPLYRHHTSARSDLQSPLALNPSSPSHAPVLIDNYYIIGVHSPNLSTTSIYDI
jgi:hypothetical protein